MAIPANWHEITVANDGHLGAALALVQKSFVDGQYDRMNVRILRGKQVPTAPAHRIWLLAYSYPNLDDPDVSVFFFFRQKFGPQAYCLSVGARPYSAGPPPVGLPATALLAQLVAICQYVRDDVLTQPQKTNFEMMHAGTVPYFRDPTGNLADAYNAARAPSSEPILQVPTTGPSPTIRVDEPWTEGQMDLYRFSINV
jgi:hypothetical protein